MRILPTLHRLVPFLAVALVAISHSGEAAPPADRLLPDTTTGFLSIGDVDRLDQQWQASQFGRLVADPAMQPFVEHVQAELEKRASVVKKRIGLSLSDLEGIASGEVAVAVVRPAQGTTAVAVLADTTGREVQVRDLLADLEKNLLARRARQRAEVLGETRLVEYTLPPEERTGRTDTIVVFVRDDVLCATSSRDLAESIFARFAAGARGQLADVPAYQATMQRCAAAAGQLAPDLRWFVEPFGFANALRELQEQGTRSKRRGKDVAEILQRHGFDAIQGAGGYVNLHVEHGIELLHRTSVYVDPNRGTNQNTALQLLQFPALGDLLPQAWVPEDIATYASFNWDVQNAFDHLAPLADELYLTGPGDFDTVLRGIAEDEHGPKVDIRNEVIAYLGRRVTAITRYELPITPKSEQFLFAVESTDDQALADSIRRLMEADKWQRRREFNGYILWETVEEPISDPIKLKVEDDALAAPEFEIVPFESKRDKQQMDAPPPRFPRSAVAVADGHLWFASHIDYLKEILTAPPPGEQLAQAVDFARVKTTISALAPESLSVRSFSRTDQEYRPTFELLRQGMMPQSETLLGRVLNEMLANEDAIRQQKLDGSKLPPFEEVEQYFGPAGLIVSPEDDGWFIVGTMLSSDTAEVARKPAASK